MDLNELLSEFAALTDPHDYGDRNVKTRVTRTTSHRSAYGSQNYGAKIANPTTAPDVHPKAHFTPFPTINSGARRNFDAPWHGDVQFPTLNKLGNDMAKNSAIGGIGVGRVLGAAVSTARNNRANKQAVSANQAANATWLSPQAVAQRASQRSANQQTAQSQGLGITNPITRPPQNPLPSGEDVQRYADERNKEREGVKSNREAFQTNRESKRSAFYDQAAQIGGSLVPSPTAFDSRAKESIAGSFDRQSELERLRTIKSSQNNGNPLTTTSDVPPTNKRRAPGMNQKARDMIGKELDARSKK